MRSFQITKEIRCRYKVRGGEGSWNTARVGRKSKMEWKWGLCSVVNVKSLTFTQKPGAWKKLKEMVGGVLVRAADKKGRCSERKRVALGFWQVVRKRNWYYYGFAAALCLKCVPEQCVGHFPFSESLLLALFFFLHTLSFLTFFFNLYLFDTKFDLFKIYDKI